MFGRRHRKPGRFAETFVVDQGLVFAALRGFDTLGLVVLGFAFAVRMAAVAAVLGVALRDYASLRSMWLVPFKDVLSLAGDPRAVIDLARVRPLPRVSESLSVPEALSRMRRTNSHLALVTARDGGAVVAMIALEDLVRDLVGLVRDGTGRA